MGGRRLQLNGDGPLCHWPHPGAVLYGLSHGADFSPAGKNRGCLKNNALSLRRRYFIVDELLHPRTQRGRGRGLWHGTRVVMQAVA